MEWWNDGMMDGIMDGDPKWDYGIMEIPNGIMEDEDTRPIKWKIPT